MSSRWGSVADFVEYLGLGVPLVMSGAIGTEIQRRGGTVRSPLWTTDALKDRVGRDLVTAIHSEYVEAGAQLLTTNTFRTNPHTAGAAGLNPAISRRWTQHAVELAQAAAAEAADSIQLLIAGSVAPFGDCYRPEEVPDNTQLEDDHFAHVANLVDAGVDLILAESQNTAREAAVICQAVRKHRVPIVVSFVCGGVGRILSGEPWQDVVDQLFGNGSDPSLLGVNCSSVENTLLALDQVTKYTDVGLAIYPNIENRVGLAAQGPVDEYVPPLQDPENFARWCETTMSRYPIRLIGGCCGSTPAHIQKLSMMLRPIEVEKIGSNFFQQIY